MSSLYFYYSSMNSGKTTALIQSNYNYHERGMKTLVIKPSIDDRDGVNIIKSRIGIETDAIVFSPDSDLYQLIRDYHVEESLGCVFVDESQFMTKEQVDQLAFKVVDGLNIPVLCYGLRTDFQGEVFPGSARLLAIADKLVELKGICWCGRKATCVLRLDSNGKVIRDGEQVVIGGNNLYTSVCRKHFKLAEPNNPLN